MKQFEVQVDDVFGNCPRNVCNYYNGIPLTGAVPT